ncbi:MAG: glycosyl hydrolase [Bacteroidia bacterium]|nr:glycosyl hydrolase [Bacteroidia bacterium]
MSLHAQDNPTSNTFSAMEVRWLGPATTSGRITSIAGNEQDPKIVFVGTAGGGVWKTTNAGASFKPVFKKHCQSIGAIAIDPGNRDVIYVGTGESNMRNTVSYGDGIYKSTDGGENWDRTGLDSTEHISKIVIDPKNTNTLYVAVPGALWSDSKSRGLYKSTDGGATWQKILYIDEKTGCADIVMNPKNPDELLATMWQFRRHAWSFSSGGPGSGMYKTTNGGKSWRKIPNLNFADTVSKSGSRAWSKNDSTLGRIALALSTSEPNHILAIVEAKTTKLFVSRDGGETWKKQAATANVECRPFYFSTIAFDPKDDKRVYRPALGLSISDDGGGSFTDASNDGGWVHSDQHAIWINPEYTNQVWLGTDGGVYLSNDKGMTFTFIQDLPVAQFYHVQTDNAEPYNVYGGLQDNGSWMAPSEGYGGVSNGDWRGYFGGDGFWAQPDPNEPGIVYAEAQGGEAGRVNLKTGLSVNIQPEITKNEQEDKLRWNWNTPIYIGAANNHNLYMGAQYLYKSTNQGQDWQRISPDLTTNDKSKLKQEQSGGLSADNTAAENYCTIFTVAESPLDENYIFAGTDDGNLQITTNGGKTWANVAKNYLACGIPDQPYISSIEPSRFDKNTLYATFDAHASGNFNTYLAKSTDLGKTWKRITSPEFTGFAHKIKEDIVNRNLLFLGTERGLFCSLDGGNHWFRMKSHIPDYTMVDDITIQPKTNDLVLATYGLGIMIIDDITPIRSMTTDIFNKDVYLYPMKPVKLTFGNYEGWKEHDGYVAGNSPEIAPIEYYLKNRLMTGDISIKILDDSGKLIRDIPEATNRKGLNKVTWDLRMTPPKTAQGGSKPDFGGLTAPMVLPGKYKVVLNVAGKEYSETITLINDDKGKMTLADRKAQYDAAMKCYRMHEALAVLADTVNRTIANVKAALLLNPGDKKLNAFLDSLQSFKGTLMPTKTVTWMVDEIRLREKISQTYSNICSQEAAPNNLQLENIDYLQGELDKSVKKGNKLLSEYQTKWKKKSFKG